MDINNPHLFDAEKDYMASKAKENIYEDAENHVMNPKYLRIWRMFLRNANREIFGTNNIPKIATEEHIEEVKTILREFINNRFNKPERKKILLIGEETEPAE